MNVCTNKCFYIKYVFKIIVVLFLSQQTVWVYDVTGYLRWFYYKLFVLVRLWSLSSPPTYVDMGTLFSNLQLVVVVWFRTMTDMQKAVLGSKLTP